MTHWITNMSTDVSVDIIPTDISGLELWVNETTVINTDSNSDTIWNTNQGGVFSRVSGTDKPTRVTNILDEKGIIRFNNSRARGSVNFTQPYWVFMVIKPDPSDTTNGVIGNSNNSNYILTNDNTIQIDAGAQLATYYTPNEFMLFGAKFDGTNSQIRINKSTVISGNAGSNNISGHFYLGGLYNSASFNSNMDLAEILIYDADLNDNDVYNIESYLGRKWGI